MLDRELYVKVLEKAVKQLDDENRELNSTIDTLRSMNHGKGAAVPHVLYVCYDSSLAIIYTGITSNYNLRIAQHRRRKDWWHEVATIEVEDYEDRWAALRAEYELIMENKPKYNLKSGSLSDPVSVTEEDVDDDTGTALSDADYVKGSLEWYQTYGKLPGIHRIRGWYGIGTGHATNVQKNVRRLIAESVETSENESESEDESA